MTDSCAFIVGCIERGEPDISGVCLRGNQGNQHQQHDDKANNFIDIR